MNLPNHHGAHESNEAGNGHPNGARVLEIGATECKCHDEAALENGNDHIDEEGLVGGESESLDDDGGEILLSH